jgi:hypothetical protein
MRTGFDDVTVDKRVGQVAELPVDPGDDDVAFAPEQVRRCGLLSDRSLVSGDDNADAG